MSNRLESAKAKMDMKIAKEQERVSNRGSVRGSVTPYQDNFVKDNYTSNNRSENNDNPDDLIKTAFE